MVQQSAGPAPVKAPPGPVPGPYAGGPPMGSALSLPERVRSVLFILYRHLWLLLISVAVCMVVAVLLGFLVMVYTAITHMRGLGLRPPPAQYAPSCEGEERNFF